MPMREQSKRQCREIIPNSRMHNPPPLINDQDKNYCSCPPFECICVQNSNNTNHHYHQNHSPSSYQPASNIEQYWTQESASNVQQFQHDLNLNGQQYDFNGISTDLFQPEEIFQLDQPIKPDYVQIQNDIARSPPTLLDLGSGTIHREYKSEEYWQQQNLTNLVNDDNSNNSSSSRLYFNSSPDNSQISLNNSPALSQTDINYLGIKLDDAYTIPKYEYYNQMQEQEYENQFPDISDTKLFFNDEQNVNNHYEMQYPKSVYRNCNFEGRFPEKYDAPQFVDYTKILNVCENKITTNEAIFNEIDLKINTFNSNFHYSGETFENLVSQ